MKKRLLLIAAFLLTVLFVSISCESKETKNDVYDTNQTLYPKEISVIGNKIWYTTGDVVDGVKSYNLHSEVTASLCADPTCNHNNKDCILYMFCVMNLVSYDNRIVLFAEDYTEQKSGYYCFDLVTQELNEIYTFSDSFIYPLWCISDDSLYFRMIESTNKEGEYKDNVYKLSVDGAQNKPECVTHNHTNPIYDFWVDNGDVYYIEGTCLTRNGEPVISDVWKIEFSIADDFIYFSKNAKAPDWPEYEDPERVKGSHGVYDLYRMPISGNENEAEFLVENVYSHVYINDQKVYYLPYDMSLAYSYPMPGAEDTERVFDYDFSNGSIAVYDIQSKTNTVLFEDLGLIIWSIVGVTEDYIIVDATDYRNVVTEGELKNTDKSAYYDNTGYYKISIDGKEIERLPIE